MTRRVPSFPELVRLAATYGGRLRVTDAPNGERTIDIDFAASADGDGRDELAVAIGRLNGGPN